MSWSPAEQVVVEFIAPLQNALTKTVRRVEEIWDKYFGLVRVYEENRALLEEIQSLRLENFKYREMLATYHRLSELLQFKESSPFNMMSAQVIGRDPTGLFKSIIIDKGARSGVLMDMPVVSAQGVVGRVVSVSPNYSKVLLIIDPNSALDCINQATRDQGILRGVSAETCELDFVLKTSSMNQGDILITSGMCGVFPKGLPVGEVARVSDRPGALFKDVEVHTMVDFNRLEEVLVILKEDPSTDRRK